MTSPNTIIADMQAEIDALRKERDELIAICEKVVNYGIGASDVKAMREAIAKARIEEQIQSLLCIEHKAAA